MRRVLKLLILTAAVALVCSPVPAHADGFAVPWAGANWGSNISNGRGSFGVSAGYMGAGIIGGEADFGYSPSFFGTQNDFGHNSVINAMGNLIVGVPIGGTYGAWIRPYVVGGAGLLRTQIDGGTIAHVSSANNQWGWDAGFGVMGTFTDHVGLRGDLRYLRGFKDLATGNTVIDLSGNNQLHFWRLSAGVVLK